MVGLSASFLRIEGIGDEFQRPYVRVIIGNQESSTPICRPSGGGTYQVYSTCGGFEVDLDMMPELRLEVIDEAKDVIVGMWGTRKFQAMVHPGRRRWCGTIPLNPHGALKAKFEVTIDKQDAMDPDLIDLHVIAATSLDRRRDLGNLEVSCTIGDQTRLTGRAAVSEHGTGATAEWLHRMNFRYRREKLIHIKLLDSGSEIGFCVFDLVEALRKKRMHYSVKSRRIQIVSTGGNVIGDLIVGLTFWNSTELTEMMNSALVTLGPIDSRATRAHALAVEAVRIAPDEIRCTQELPPTDEEIAKAIALANQCKNADKGRLENLSRNDAKKEVANIKKDIPMINEHIKRAEKHAVTGATHAAHEEVTHGIVAKEAIDRSVAMCIHAFPPDNISPSLEMEVLEKQVLALERDADATMRKLNESFIGCKACSTVPPVEAYLKQCELCRIELEKYRLKIEELQFAVEELAKKEREFMRKDGELRPNLEGGGIVEGPPPNGSMFCCCCC